jgi:hypothetical protein
MKCRYVGGKYMHFMTANKTERWLDNYELIYIYIEVKIYMASGA